MKKLFFIFILLFSVPVLAQQKINLVEKTASLMKSEAVGDQRVTKFIRAKDKQLEFITNDTKINCDTAILFPNNVVEATGRVKINDRDSIIITSKYLHYDGNLKEARLTGNVILTDDSVTLYTEQLDYFQLENLAVYKTGGKLKDPTNDLASVRGYYLTDQKTMAFKKNVVLVNPDYTMKTDSLVYNTLTKVAYTFDKTNIVSTDGNTVEAQAGEYNTTASQTFLSLGRIETDKYILQGDYLRFDDSKRYYSAIGNVVMISKENDVIITGNEALSWRSKGITKVFGNPLMKKLIQEDTMYVRGDTLVSLENKQKGTNHIQAYNNVRFFKSDLQGIADSLVYLSTDSTITLFNDPVLWNNESQMLADTVVVTLKNGTIDKLFLNMRSFVIQEDTLLNQFNQIKGRDMIAHFADSGISHVDVNGNGESLYFPQDEDSTLLGMNVILCSNMHIIFKNNAVHDINFIKKPDATLFPPDKIVKEDRFLKGFMWRQEERPTLSNILLLTPIDIDVSENLTKPAQIPKTSTKSPLTIDKPAEKKRPGKILPNIDR